MYFYKMPYKNKSKKLNSKTSPRRCIYYLAVCKNTKVNYISVIYNGVSHWHHQRRG